MRMHRSLPRLVPALLAADLGTAFAIALAIPAPKGSPALGAVGTINGPPDDAE
jgi:hypothetical protein